MRGNVAAGWSWRQGWEKHVWNSVTLRHGRRTEPEIFVANIFKGDFLKIDVWSVGCILYRMHFGKIFEWQKYIHKKLQRRKNGIKDLIEANIEVKKEIRKIEAARRKILEKKKLSKKDKFQLFIFKLLEINPDKRLTMKEAYREIDTI